MSDDNSDLELQIGPRDSGGLRGFQFSLASIFVVMTGLAVILSAFFSIGQLVGMTTQEVVARGLMYFLYYLPMFLVWLVGLTIAFRRRRQNRLPAILTMIALGVLALTSFITCVLQMVLIHWVDRNGMSSGIMTWAFAALGLFSTVVHTACWTLILVAIFVRRPPDK
jgi:hypothetical protein